MAATHRFANFRCLTTLLTAAAVIVHLVLDGICADPCDAPCSAAPVAVFQLSGDRSLPPDEHSCPHDCHAIGDYTFTATQSRTTVDRDDSFVAAVVEPQPLIVVDHFADRGGRVVASEHLLPLGLHVLYRSLRI